MKRLFLYLFLLFVFIPSEGYGLSFGKNKVIVDKHKWYIAETEHFEIYHYPEAKSLIPKVGRLLEKAYERVTGILKYEPGKKAPFFLS